MQDFKNVRAKPALSRYMLIERIFLSPYFYSLNGSPRFSTIMKNARIEFYLKSGIFIPNENTCCHLNEANLIYNHELTYINESYSSTEFCSVQIKRFLKELRESNYKIYYI